MYHCNIVVTPERTEQRPPKESSAFLPTIRPLLMASTSRRVLTSRARNGKREARLVQLHRRKLIRGGVCLKLLPCRTNQIGLAEGGSPPRMAQRLQKDTSTSILGWLLIIWEARSFRLQGQPIDGGCGTLEWFGRTILHKNGSCSEDMHTGRCCTF